MGRGDKASATRAFQNAMEADPKFTRATLELVLVYMMSAHSDSALDVLRKAIDSDPKHLVLRQAYAFILTSLKRWDAAIDALREVIQVSPDDAEVNSMLGALLMSQKRYGEAVPFLETAARSDSSVAGQTRLGAAYMRAGQIEKGTAVLDSVVHSDSVPDTLNNVAYELADANVNLPKALDYALHAVDVQEEESHGADIANLLPEDLTCTRKIEMSWDTLGWVHFRLGRLDQAESYLHGAGLLSQNGVEADHLGQIYEQQKKTEKAIHMYRLPFPLPRRMRQAAHGTRPAIVSNI